MSQVGTVQVIEGLTSVGTHAGLQPDGRSIWWPDWDFLMTGGQGCNDTITPHCPNMTDVEYRSEFSFWTLASSNLILATDPRVLTPIMKEVRRAMSSHANNEAGTSFHVYFDILS